MYVAFFKGGANAARRRKVGDLSAKASGKEEGAHNSDSAIYEGKVKSARAWNGSHGGLEQR